MSQEDKLEKKTWFRKFGRTWDLRGVEANEEGYEYPNGQG